MIDRIPTMAMKAAMVAELKSMTWNNHNMTYQANSSWLTPV